MKHKTLQIAITSYGTSINIFKKKQEGKIKPQKYLKISLNYAKKAPAKCGRSRTS